MGKIIKLTTGFLSEIKNLDKNDKYKCHLNVPGILILGESEHKYPGKRFIYLYTDVYLYTPDGFEIVYFHTSCGTVIEKDDKWIFNNEYVFTIDENCLTEKQKNDIFNKKKEIGNLSTSKNDTLTRSQSLNF